MSNSLVWKRDPVLDTYTGTVDNHEFISMRTYLDVAVLYHNDIEIRRSGSDGSHKNNIAFAEKIFEEQLKMRSWINE